eukprot:2500130-Rhodomonas_salina.1
MAGDPRLAWLRGKVCRNLNLQDSAFDELLGQEARPSQSYQQAFNDWLDSSAVESMLLFFVEERTIAPPEGAPSALAEPEEVKEQESEAEQSVAEPEEGETSAEGAEEGAEAPPAEAPAEGEAAANGEEAPPAEEKPEEEGAAAEEGEKDPAADDAGSGDGSGEGSGEGGATEESGAETHEEQLEKEETPQPVQTIVPKVKIEYILHCRIDEYPEFDIESRIVYMVKSGSALASVEEMDAKLEYGIMFGPNLLMLEQILNHVYLPLLSSNRSASTGDYEEIEKAVDSDLLNSLQKFVSQVKHAVQQVAGEVRLNIPSVSLDDEKMASSDQGILLDLESAVSDWTHQIQRIVQQEAQKQPQGKGPLAEIEFWRSKSASLSTLYEQLNLPHIKRVIRVLETAANKNESD